MKSALVIAAAVALCGSAFAGTGVLNTVKQDAHQIGSSFRHDAHRIARGDTFREQQAADQRRAYTHTHSMGAGRAYREESSSRQARMDAAYANWERRHR